MYTNEELYDNTVNNHYSWTSYLCRVGDEKEFHEILSRSKNTVLAIMKYRRELRCRGLGNPSFIELNTALIQNNYNRLHSLLQELFLESLTQREFDFILNKIYTTENGMEKLYNYHKKYINMRAIAIAMML